MELSYSDPLYSWLSKDPEATVVPLPLAQLPRVKAWHMYPVAPDTQRGSVLFCHGLGNDALYPHMWLFKRLLQEGFHIVSFDLDGHGRDSSSLWEESSFKGCLVRFLESLQNSAFLPQPYFGVGYSLGALLWLNLPPSWQKEFQALAYCGCPGVGLSITKEALWAEALLVTKPSFRRMVHTFGLYQSLPAVGWFKRSRFPMRFHPSPPSNPPFGGPAWTDAFLKSLSSHIEAPTVPALFVWGEQDLLCRVQEALAHFAAMPLVKGSRCVAIPGENHISLLMAAQAIEAVTTFLVGSAPPPSSGSTRIS